MNEFEKQIIELKKFIKETEIEIIDNLINKNPCPEISNNLVKVIDENVGKIDQESQNILRCIIKKFLSQYNSEEIFNLPNPEKEIINLLNTKKILGQGYFGTTVLVGIEDSKPFTVMKFSRGIESDRHELAVGLLLNQLRNEIPNFVYTYGGIICTNPIDNNTFEGLCENKDKQSVIIFTEYIPGGFTLQNFLTFEKSLSFQFIFDIITQVIYSIITANQKIGFVHTDLHTENILVRNLDKTIELNYEINLGEGYQEFTKFNCKTNHISTIIDFGLSHYTYQDKRIDMGFKDSLKNDLYKYLNFISKFYDWYYYQDLNDLIEMIYKISTGELLKRWFQIRDKTLNIGSTYENINFPKENISSGYDFKNIWL